MPSSPLGVGDRYRQNRYSRLPASDQGWPTEDVLSASPSFAVGRSCRLMLEREQRQRTKREEQLVMLTKRRKRVDVFERNHPDATVPMIFTDDGWVECSDISKLQDPASTSMLSSRRGTFFGLYPFGGSSKSLKQQQAIVRANRDKAVFDTETFRQQYSMAEQFDIAKEARALQRSGRAGEMSHLTTADTSGFQNPYSRGWLDYLDERRHRNREPAY